MAARLADAGPELQTFQAALNIAVDQASSCVDFVLAHFAATGLPAAGSVPFLKLMGIVLEWLAMACAASPPKPNWPKTAPTWTSPHRQTDHRPFYGEHLLPRERLTGDSARWGIGAGAG